MDRHAAPGGRPGPWRLLLAACAALALVAACAPEPQPRAGRATDAATAPAPGSAPTPGPAQTPGSAPEGASPEPAPATAPERSPGTASWETVAPEEAGLAADLEARVEAALAEHPGVRTVLVARGGRLAVELERGDATHHNTFSVTKSVVGTLAGIAVGEGALTLDTRVGDVLADRLPATAGEGVAALTVEALGRRRMRTRALCAV